MQRTVAPAFTHHVALQASVLGSLAAIGRPGARVNALTGFGYAFISDSLKSRALRAVIRLRPATGSPIGRTPWRWCKTRTTARACSHSASRPITSRSFPVPASMSSACKPAPEPSGTPAMAFVGRLLDDKGIRTPGRRASAAARARLDVDAADRRHARPRQSGLGGRERSARPGTASRASRGSAMSPTSPGFGRAPQSRCCRRAAKACRSRCWRPRPAVAR